MSTVSEFMTSDVQTIEPQETLQHAAQLMDQLNVGSLPVCNGRRVLGMITDRDITIRATAAGLAPTSACVSDAMSTEVLSCREDEDANDVMERMGEAQVRRLPVIDGDGELVGIVALGDMATRQRQPVDEVVRKISTPSEPDGGAAHV
ncbi:MAG: CBS domain-containing protein [Burkholderiaceae bacterium]